MQRDTLKTMKSTHALEPLTVTVESAAALSGLSRRTIWGLLKDGRLDSKMIGRRRLIPTQALKTFLLGPEEGQAQ